MITVRTKLQIVNPSTKEDKEDKEEGVAFEGEDYGQLFVGLLKCNLATFIASILNSEKDAGKRSSRLESLKKALKECSDSEMFDNLVNAYE